MCEKISLKLCRVILVVSIASVLTYGYSVQAEQSSQTLYHYIMDTYSKSYTDVSATKRELDKLKSEYRVAKNNNLQAESFESSKEYSLAIENEINLKIDKQVYDFKKKQDSVLKEMEVGILDLSPMELSVLNRKYSKLQEDIDSVLQDKTSLSSLFSNVTYNTVDTSGLELSIKEKEDSISYDSSNNNMNLGDIFKLKLPFNYSHVLTSHAGYRTDPINGSIKYHNGTDYAMPVGIELYSLFNGKVVESSLGGGYGEYIKIDCGNGIVILYAHLSKRSVKVGDYVNQNQVIGLSGNTGRSTGPHLHLSLFYKGEVLDVERLFQ